MSARTAYVLSVAKLSRKHRRLGGKMLALAKSCVRWLHYGWRVLTNAKLLRMAAASIAFAATLAATGQTTNAGGAVSPLSGGFRVNQGIAGPQVNPQVAMDGDGDYVVVWTNFASYGSPRVSLRRYNADGSAAGPEFDIGFTGPPTTQDFADVAMDAEGNFTVVWQEPGDGWGMGIFAQRFDASGARVGDRILVNTRTYWDQEHPVIGMDADGDFVVAWSATGVDTTFSNSSGYQQQGVAARLFDSAGSPKGDQFVVNNTLAYIQRWPSVAMDQDGDFVVGWESNYNDGDGWGAMARRFNAEGEAQGYEFEVNTGYSGTQDYVGVGMDADGDFVVTWHSYHLELVSFYNSSMSYGSYYAWHNSVLMRRYDADGAALAGDEFVAQGMEVGTDQRYFEPAVALDAEGEINVVYRHFDDGVDKVRLSRYDASGAAIGSSQVVNTVGPAFVPDVATDDRGDLIVVRDGNGAGDNLGIFGRQFVVGADAAPPVVGGLYVTGDIERIMWGETLRSELVEGFTATFSEQVVEAGVENLANWSLTRNGDDVSDLIDEVAYAFNTTTRRYEAEITLVTGATLDDGEYVLTLSDAVKDTSNNMLDGDFDGAAGGDFNWEFNVASQVPLGWDINTSDNNVGPGNFVSRGFPSVAMDDDGNYVVAWHEVRNFYVGFPYYTSFNNADIRFRRYFADGAPNGDVQSLDFNFTSHANPASRWEVNPKVALDADGDIIIAFNSYAGGGGFSGSYNAEIFALGFNYDVGNLDNGDVVFGTAALVPPSNIQDFDLACSADGDFVVAAKGLYGGNWHIVAQRFNADGSWTSGPFVIVDQYYTGQPWSPSVAMDDDGNFVVAWQSLPSYDFRVKARRFNRYSNPATGDIIVSDAGDGISDLDPDVAVDHDGDFVVVWETYHFDYSTSSWLNDVAMRRLRFDGSPVAPVELANSSTNDLSRPAIAMDADGEFVVAWVDYGDYVSNSGNSYTLGIFGRRFNALGNPQGGRFIANATLSGDQIFPVVAMDADGDFVIAWHGYANARYYYSYSSYFSWSSYNVSNATLHRRFGTNEAPRTWLDGASAEFDEDENVGPLQLNQVFRDSTDFDNLTYSVDVDNDDLLTVEIVGTGSGAELQLTLAQDAYGEAVLTVTATDSRGLSTEAVVDITVNSVNDAPTLTPFAPDFTDVPETETDPAGNTVAAILGNSVTDPDVGALEGIAITAKTGSSATDGQWQYQLDGSSTWTNVPGVSNAGSFLLRAQDKLRFVPLPGFIGDVTITYRAWDQTTGSVATLVSTTSNGNATAFSAATDTATLSVNSVNDAPVLDNSGSPVVTAVFEDEIPANIVGTSVASLVGGSITDVDPGAVEGIAVVAADMSNGLWQFLLDGDSVWVNFFVASDGAALLLRPQDMVRFVPGPDFEGSATITYRAWDQTGATAGAHGTYANTLPAGGESAFSTAIEVATVDVVPVNDRPVLTPAAPQLTDVAEDDNDPAGDMVSDILDSSVTDVDSGAVEGIAITGVTGSANGTWQYSTNGGVDWNDITGVSATNALLLADTALLRYLPDADFNGNATVSYRGWDQTAGGNGTMMDPGSSSAFSLASDIATVTVLSSPDAPVLDNSGSPFLTDVAEDDTDPAGDEISSIVGSSITDADAGALEGIAVTGADGANGMWQFSVNGGASWEAVLVVSDDSALLLRSTDMLRFIPATDFNGSATVTYRAWDRTTGLAGDRVDTTVNGGMTAFSTAVETATVDIDNENDAPILDTLSIPSLGTILSNSLDPAGTSVGTLVTGLITDPDPSALEGVAIVGFTGSSNGQWQYSTDGGASYIDITAASEGEALLLASSDLVRYVPELGFDGTATISFRAWDRTTGSSGDVVDLTVVGATGGSTAFSADAGIAVINVDAVVVPPDDDGGDDSSGCSAETGGAAWGLLAILMALAASLRGLVGARRAE
ncbi:MAG: hypothetical protein IT462_06170 [Planctomycetes bacterium]|nr:hypothetical protein [Planctomycetota bacterium]